jgi:hypothetical protein
MFNDIKVGVKLIGSIAVVCMLTALLLLYGAKIRHDLLNQVD